MKNAANVRMRENGFTLIELLAVVAIMLLLLSLLLPVLQRGRGMALDARCKSNLHQMGIMEYNFAQDHDGVLPVGGSVGGQMGSINWQRCWMGMEVLIGTKYEGTTIPNTQWPKDTTGMFFFGTLFPYMGNDVATAKRLYRCIAQAACADGDLGLGYGSNGYFDYAMVMAFSVATLGNIPTTATLHYNNADPTTWQKKPTPLAVEEDPFWNLNRYPNVEPGHGNTDKIGVWHYGHGNYLAVNGSVNECRPLDPNAQLNPDLNNWHVTGPNGSDESIGSYPAFGTWPSR